VPSVLDATPVIWKFFRSHRLGQHAWDSPARISGSNSW
jgi:hypothetical protein